MSNGLIFPLKMLGKTDRLSRPPIVVSTCRCIAALRSYPDCQRCALAIPCGHARVPSLPRCCARGISAPRSARELPSGDFLLATALAVGVLDADTVRPTASPGLLRRPSEHIAVAPGGALFLLSPPGIHLSLFTSNSSQDFFLRPC